MTTEKLALDDFSGRVGNRFVVRDADAPPVELILAEAKSLPSLNRPAEFRAPFQLMFLAKEGPVLPQKLYCLEHEAMGRVTIFLVPASHDAQGTRYCATFN